MAWAQVQENDSGLVNGVGVTTRSVVYGATPTQNNLLLAFACASSDGTGLTLTSAGWSAVNGTGAVQYGATQYYSGWWYKVAGASESTTVTVTTTNAARLSLKIIEMSGNSTTSPLDGFSLGTGAAAANSGCAEPTKDGGLYCFAWAQHGSGADATFSSSDTNYWEPVPPTTHWLVGGAASHRNGNDNLKSQALWSFYYGTDGVDSMNSQYVIGNTASSDDYMCWTAVFKSSGGSTITEAVNSGGTAVFSRCAVGTVGTVTPAGGAPTNGYIMFVAVSGALGTGAQVSFRPPKDTWVRIGQLMTSQVTTSNQVVEIWAAIAASEATTIVFAAADEAGAVAGINFWEFVSIPGITTKADLMKLKPHIKYSLFSDGGAANSATPRVKTYMDDNVVLADAIPYNLGASVTEANGFTQPLGSSAGGTPFYMITGTAGWVSCRVTSAGIADNNSIFWIMDLFGGSEFNPAGGTESDAWAFAG